jgi:hypothetical protein
MAGRDDDNPTMVEEVPSFARDATLQEEPADDDGGVFSDSGPGEAVAGPVPAQTDVGEMPTELRPMDPGELGLDDEPGDTVNVGSAEQDVDEAGVTRADVVDVSLGSLVGPDDDGDVFSDSDEGEG